MKTINGSRPPVTSVNVFGFAICVKPLLKDLLAYRYVSFDNSPWMNHTNIQIYDYTNMCRFNNNRIHRIHGESSSRCVAFAAYVSTRDRELM